MGFFAVAAVVLCVCVVFFLVMTAIEQTKMAGMSAEEREAYLVEQGWKRSEEDERREREQEQLKQLGPINPAMVCPHCQAKGTIRTQKVKLKKGISGGKATAAVLTGGWSLVATGLSRKEEATKAHCGNCNNTWVF